MVKIGYKGNGSEYYKDINGVPVHEGDEGYFLDGYRNEFIYGKVVAYKDSYLCYRPSKGWETNIMKNNTDRMVLLVKKADGTEIKITK